jgi:thiosulfate dehydrogenase [quinone] large subunit
MYVLTAVSVGIFVFLTWAFADGLFNTNWWDSAVYTDSAIFTWILMGIIIAIGVYQARQLPAEGVPIEFGAVTDTKGQTEDPKFWRLIMGNVYWSILWVPIRFFVGRDWMAAGEHKLRSASWMDGGSALQGYWKGAVAVPDSGSPRVTYGWYRDFLNYMLNHEWYTWFAKVIAIGEFLVGIGLVVGALVGIAAFFGTLMNFNFMLAGSSSSNPVLFGLAVFLVLAWKVAGYFGVDRVLLPALGAPWKAGELFGGEGIPQPAPTTPHRAEPA